MVHVNDSDEDDVLYTTTNVLLGYADEPVTTSAESSTPADTISHIGGTPSWLSNCQPPDSKVAKCLSCNQFMPLLLQLDGNIAESPWHERMLYIFGCKEKRCRRKPGSIRTLRGVKLVAEKVKENKEEKVEQPAKDVEVKMGDMLFGGGVSLATNPFASGSTNTNPFASSSVKENPFASKTIQDTTESSKEDPTVASLTKSFADIAASNVPAQPSSNSKPTSDQTPSTTAGPPAPWPDTSGLPSYPVFFLDAHYEELDSTADALTQQAQKLAKNVKIEDDEDLDMGESSTSGSKGTGKEKDVFESAMNETFDHFSTITSQNPEQVLRYERRGQPLFYSNTDAVGKTGLSAIPRCLACGEKRVFEIQLMPHLITVLEEASDIDVLSEGLDWGTIIMATCGADCTLRGDSAKGNTYGYVEEWCGVQWEDDVKRQ